MSESAAPTSRDNLSTAIDPSHEADLLLADLDVVLRCRCCTQPDGFVADWVETERAFSGQTSPATAYWGETR